MEAPHPIIESMHPDKEGRAMVLRVNSARQYEATAMAAAYGIKRLDNYWTTKDAIEVVEAVSRLQGIPASELKVVVNTGPKHLHGTWVHEDVALHLAAWLSKDFYAFMLQTFRRYIRGEITTEESKAAKKALDARHEQDRIKYEQSQKQLQAAQKDLAISEGERKLAVANQQKFWRQVDHATAEVVYLQKELGLKRQTAAKRKRAHEGKVFLQEVSRVLQEYRDGVPGPWPEVEGPLEKSIPELLAWWDQDMSSGWLGRDLSMFGELPAKKGNPKQWNVLFADAEKESCRYDNVIPAPNHETKAKLWQTGG